MVEKCRSKFWFHILFPLHFRHYHKCGIDLWIIYFANLDSGSTNQWIARLILTPLFRRGAVVSFSHGFSRLVDSLVLEPWYTLFGLLFFRFSGIPWGAATATYPAPDPDSLWHPLQSWLVLVGEESISKGCGIVAPRTGAPKEFCLNRSVERLNRHAFCPSESLSV